MSDIFHEGEQYIQDLMGVYDKTNNNSPMRRANIPAVASNFLESLNFSVLVLSTNNKDIFSTVVYGVESFIEVRNDMKISIKLNKHSHIPAKFFDEELLNIGFIGLDFELKMRMRINGKAKIENNSINISIDEIYANCPKYIIKRVLLGELKEVGSQNIGIEKVLSNSFLNVIKDSDTFFLGTFHEKDGLDISHKAGDKGFVKVVSSTQVEFDDKTGNNYYNSLGNIHTNPYVSMLFIDFKSNNTYHISGKATVKIIVINNMKTLKVIVNCLAIMKSKNSFMLHYDK